MNVKQSDDAGTSAQKFHTFVHLDDSDMLFTLVQVSVTKASCAWYSQGRPPSLKSIEHSGPQHRTRGLRSSLIYSHGFEGSR